MRPIRRRDLLGRSCALGALACTSRAVAAPRPLKVIVVGGHPGDPEYGCGGTIARLTGFGHEVVLLYLNEGVPAGKPRDGARVAEAQRACEILKARPMFAGQIDGDSVVDRPHSDAFRALIEPERPDLVFTHWPIDNHADHRAASMLAYEAWLRMRRSFALYYYEVSNGEDTMQFSPTRLVDITEVEAAKKQACFAHASQSPERYYALQDRVARMRGLERGCRQAEGFVRIVQGPDLALPFGL